MSLPLILFHGHCTVHLYLYAYALHAARSGVRPDGARAQLPDRGRLGDPRERRAGALPAARPALGASDPVDGGAAAERVGHDGGRVRADGPRGGGSLHPDRSRSPALLHVGTNLLCHTLQSYNLVIPVLCKLEDTWA